MHVKRATLAAVAALGGPHHALAVGASCLALLALKTLSRGSQQDEGQASTRRGIVAHQRHAPVVREERAHVATTALPPEQSAAAPPAAPGVWPATLHALFQLLMGAALGLAAHREAHDLLAVLLVAALVYVLSGQGTVTYSAAMAGACGGSGPSARGQSAAAAAATGAGGQAGEAVAPVEASRSGPAVPDPRLAGTWIKDPSRSDPMDEAVAAMRLNGLVRTAIRLIRGLEVGGLQQGRFDFAVFSIISWFKVRESYRLDGSVGHFKRRDLRKGKHSAFASVRPDGSLVMALSWGEPMAGAGTDHFQLLPAQGAERAAGACPAPHEDDLLVVTSTLRLGPAAGAGPGARVVVYKTTYVRKGRKRHHEQDPGHDEQGLPQGAEGHGEGHGPAGADHQGQG